MKYFVLILMCISLQGCIYAVPNYNRSEFVNDFYITQPLYNSPVIVIDKPFYYNNRYFKPRDYRLRNRYWR